MPPLTKRLRWGPVTRQKDRVVSLNVAPNAALGILNCWVRDSDTEFPIIEGRPGFYIAGVTMGAIAVQWIGQLSKADGTEISACVAGGEIWTYNWGTDTLTKVVTTANLTTASVTLSATARVHACEFADTLVFNDDANQPFTWTGASGAGGLVSLTAMAATAYGRPWVRDGKLWFFKGSERNTALWSEEGQANLGYESGGYSNAWTLRQTATEGFVAGAGTNAANVLFRSNSITYIEGSVTPNYSSTANDEGISETVGCRSPDGVLNVGGTIYFLSNDRRILRLQGRELTDIGEGARARLSTLNAAQYAKCFVEYVDFGEQGERLLVGIPDASDHVNAYIVCNPATGLCEGTWTGWLSTALGRWKNANGEWRLVHGGGDAAVAVDRGTISIHDVPSGVTWEDEYLAGVTPITHQVETTHIGPDIDLERGWLEGVLLFSTALTLTSIAVTMITSRGERPLTNALVHAGTPQFKLDVDQLDIDAFGLTTADARIWFGTRGVFGRWARVRLTHGFGTEQFRLQEISLIATTTDRRVGTL